MRTSEPRTGIAYGCEGTRRDQLLPMGTERTRVAGEVVHNGITVLKGAHMTRQSRISRMALGPSGFAKREVAEGRKQGGYEQRTRKRRSAKARTYSEAVIAQSPANHTLALFTITSYLAMFDLVILRVLCDVEPHLMPGSLCQTKVFE